METQPTPLLRSGSNEAVVALQRFKAYATAHPLLSGVDKQISRAIDEPAATPHQYGAAAGALRPRGDAIVGSVRAGPWMHHLQRRLRDRGSGSLPSGQQDRAWTIKRATAHRLVSRRAPPIARVMRERMRLLRHERRRIGSATHAWRRSRLGQRLILPRWHHGGLRRV